MKNYYATSIMKVDLTPADGGGGAGKKTVTTAATPEQLSAVSVPCLKVVIKALSINGGLIYVGFSSDGAKAAVGFDLSANQEIEISLDDLNKIWIDCSVSGEGVSYIYVNNST